MSAQRPRTRLICALTSPDVAAMRAAMAAAVAGGADAVELRLDYLRRAPTDEELRHLLAGAPAETIATCRPAWEGGHFAGAEPARLRLLARAAQFGADFVDVESAVAPERRPGGKLILSKHDFAGCPADLEAIAAALAGAGTAVGKVAFTAVGPADALRALDVLRASDRPTIALAMGEAGLFSRILAPKFGAFGTFAGLAEGAQSAPGQPTLGELTQLYRFRRIAPATAVYGVIGCPVGHSMSPAIHNAAFDASGVDAVYVPVRVEPGRENFDRFLDALLARPWLDWRGLSVTIPHKENALARVGAGRCDELARRIGAINTVTIGPDGVLRGDNTDYAAAIDALCGAMGIDRAGLAGRRVAMLGAGGAARAIVAALAHYGADVTIYNRTVSRAERLAEEFGCAAAGRDRLDALDAEVIVNCTPIGMHPNVDAAPLERLPPSAAVVFDTIYNPVRTRLLRQASAAGCRCVTGLDMFVSQAVAQFETWTGRPAPRDEMRRAVVERLGAGP